MKHKVAELEGALLDAAVAELELPPGWRGRYGRPMEEELGDYGVTASRYSPSTDWAQGGPIIERERIMVGPETEYADGSWLWEACTWTGRTQNGPTPMIAAMRAYVASKFGDEVDLP